jgi:hypothetical protein
VSEKKPEDKEPRNYEVGYGKPPLHTRFRKGGSGNPNGRPRGSKSLATLFYEALDQPVVMRRDGRTKKKREVLVEQLVNRAAGGDHRAMRLLLVELPQYLEKKVEAQGGRGLTGAAEARIRRILTEPWPDHLSDSRREHRPGSRAKPT